MSLDEGIVYIIVSLVTLDIVLAWWVLTKIEKIADKQVDYDKVVRLVNSKIIDTKGLINKAENVQNSFDRRINLLEKQRHKDELEFMKVISRIEKTLSSMGGTMRHLDDTMKSFKIELSEQRKEIAIIKK